MQTRRVRAVLTLALVALCAAAAGANQQVALRFKFTQGEVLNYRFYADVNGQMSMNLPMPPGQGAGATQQPAAMRAILQGTGRGHVLKTDPTGAAWLRIKADRFTMRANMMGQNLAMQMEDGAITVWENGKQVSTAQGLGSIPGGQMMPPPDQPIELKISPRGQVLEVRLPGMEQMMQAAPFSMPGMDMRTMLKQYPQILLPQNAVPVGHTWQQTIRVPFTPQMAIPVSYRASVKGLEQVSGQQVAVVDVASNLSARSIDLGQMINSGLASAAASGQPPMPMPDMQGKMSMAVNLAGTLRFNATAGSVERFDGRQDMAMGINMTMQAPPQAQQQGQPSSMTLSMAMNFTAKFSLARI